MSGGKIKVGDKAAEIVAPIFILSLTFICCAIFHAQPIYHPLCNLLATARFIHPQWMKVYFGQKSFNSELISPKICIFFNSDFGFELFRCVSMQ